MRLIGLDPGLRVTGWGVIEAENGRLRHIANGTIKPSTRLPIAQRLVVLHDGLAEVVARHHPEAAAVEETFVNRNADSTLRLGLARGVVLLVPALAGLPVAEYAANAVKKSVVGAGHAAKEQVQLMVKSLLPTAEIGSPDAADALAVAICHAHHSGTRNLWAAGAARIAAGGQP